MSKRGSIIKWGLVSLLTLGAHWLLFQATLKNKSAEPERQELSVVEINLDITQEVATEELVESPAPEETTPPEEPEPPQPTPEEIEQERLEQERLVEEKRLEEKRLEEERLAEIQKQKELEAEKKRLEQQRLAEKKRQQEIARKKYLEEQARKKKAAAAYAAKKAREAAERKKRELATKIAKSAYSTSRKQPTYPKSLIRKKVEGVVKIKVFITTSGSVSSVSLYKSSGYSDFDKSALRAAKKWKYKPAYNGLGQAMKSSKVETIYFKLR